MTKDELRERLTAFAVKIIKMVDMMPNSISSNAIARQIVRSGTSSSANYRAACLAKSDKDFINKLKIVEEELDETNHWLDLIMRCGMINSAIVDEAYRESKELYLIISRSIKTVKNRMNADCIQQMNK
ncbi:MAG: four helix bundle protein [Prevotellaceae bacterium]|nr:four helix bundle protein [Prevotellaceae bacterium]